MALKNALIFRKEFQGSGNLVKVYQLYQVKSMITACAVQSFALCFVDRIQAELMKNALLHFSGVKCPKQLNIHLVQRGLPRYLIGLKLCAQVLSVKAAQ